MVAVAVEEVDAFKEPASLQLRSFTIRVPGNFSLVNQLRGHTASKIRQISHPHSEEAIKQVHARGSGASEFGA